MQKDQNVGSSFRHSFIARGRRLVEETQLTLSQTGLQSWMGDVLLFAIEPYSVFLKGFAGDNCCGGFQLDVK